MQPDKQYFETADLNVASFLIAKKTPYRGCYSAAEGFTVFRFKPTDQINDLVDDFAFNSPVNVQEFCAAYRFLSGEIRQTRRQAGGVR